MQTLELPLDEAIQTAAKQNFDHDLKNELVEEKDWEEDKEIYLAEAKELLTTTGENYLPENGDPWIVLKK